MGSPCSATHQGEKPLSAGLRRDASLFPMTLLVTTILHSASMLFWVVVAIGVISFICLLTAHRSENKAGQVIMISFCCAVNAFTCLVISLFIVYKMDVDSFRRQMIYRIAHVADFNSFSPCKNVDAVLDNSLYVDANRYLVLVAPKIIDTFNLETRRFSVFRSVKVPESFQVLRCVY